jgi:aspartyl-tRNA(Asn)/glutamyl-tRNA(Gln) amidotransferase subunit C
MAITSEQVDYVAHLSRLELSEEEKRKFAAQLGAILDYMQKLNELDTEEVEPMVHGIEGTEPVRPDAAGESLPREEALRNAPRTRQGCFRVPRIID